MQLEQDQKVWHYEEETKSMALQRYINPTDQCMAEQKTKGDDTRTMPLIIHFSINRGFSKI